MQRTLFLCAAIALFGFASFTDAVPLDRVNQNVEALFGDDLSLLEVMSSTEKTGLEASAAQAIAAALDPARGGALEHISHLRDIVREMKEAEERFLNATRTDNTRRQKDRAVQAKADQVELEAARKRFASAEARRAEESAADQQALQSLRAAADYRRQRRQTELDLLAKLKGALAPEKNGTAEAVIGQIKADHEKAAALEKEDERKSALAKVEAEEKAAVQNATLSVPQQSKAKPTPLTTEQKNATVANDPVVAEVVKNANHTGAPKKTCVEIVATERDVEGKKVNVPAFVNTCQTTRQVEFSFCGESLSCKVPSGAQGFPCWFPNTDLTCKTITVSSDTQVEGGL